MNTSKVAIVVSQVIEKIEKIAGICWAAFWGLFTIIFIAFSEGTTTDTTMAVLCLALCALGVIAYLAGRKREKMRRLFKDYVAELSADPSGSIENLAAATNASPDTVKKNLRYMIRKKFFTNAFIDERENCLVLLSIAQKAQKAESKEDSGIRQEDWVICTCPCCGGKNKIQKGAVAECDFCGSPLS